MRALLLPARGESWELVERLGRGGEAEVWRARPAGTVGGASICIKLSRWPECQERRRAALEEARILGRVRHPNVVRLIDAVDDDTGRIVLLLELVRGADLFALASVVRARGEPVPAAVVAVLAREICRGLGAAHRAIPSGLIHRDVSPHNVLVSTEGSVKLADFGIARAFDRARWTQSGRLKGKCAYLSPEQVKGEQCDARSDLFSLGVLAYELLAGERPFVGQPVCEQLRAIALGRRPALQDRAPRAPAPLVELVERLLEPDPEARPVNAEAGAREFARFADDELGRATLRRWVRDARGPCLASTARRISVAGCATTWETHA